MSKKLLLADDSITIQKVVGITFANEDYELTVVDNGDAGLEMARKIHPDLILADVFMPGKNGYELCAAIKQDPALAATPLLLLTGTFEPFDENKARAAGADSWIAKPFESQALIDRVEELLSRPTTVVPAPAQVVSTQAAPVSVQTVSSPAQAVPIPAPSTQAAPSVADDIWGELPATSAMSAVGAVADNWQAAQDDDDLWGGAALEEEVAVAAAPSAAAATIANDAFAAPLDDTWGDLAEEIAPASISAAVPLVEKTAVYAGQRPVAVAMASEPPSMGADWDEFDEEILALDEIDIIEEEELTPVADTFAGVATVASEMTAEPELFDPFAEIESAPLVDSTWDAAPEPAAAATAWDELPPPTGNADSAWELTDEEEPLGESSRPAPVAVPAEEASVWDMEFDDAMPAAPAAIAPEPVPPTPVAATLAVAPAVPSMPTPFPAAAVEDRVAALSEEEIARIVEKVAGTIIERLAPTILEKIVWEVVPDLAEAMIRDEIRSIKENVR